MTRVLRFGRGAVDELANVLDELGVRHPLLVTTQRWRPLGDGMPVAGVYAGVRSHVPTQTVAEAVDAAREAGAEAVVALGGGSAVDTSKAVSAALEVPLISIPTTYAGAEWTSHYGMRDEARGVKEGGGGARPVAALYDPELTLDLPPAHSGGTALNALAHCVEALYAAGRTDAGDRHAFCGARTIAHALPLVLANGHDLYARTRLLEGAMRAALALGEAGLALGHAMAQALGGRYGVAHGAANAVCLPPALKFNAPAVPHALARLAEALATNEPVTKIEELASLTGFTRLRDLGVPQEELDEVAAAAAARAGARANPRRASPAEIAELLRSVW